MLAAFAAAAAAAEPAILSSRTASLPDFSYAGYGFGLMPLPASPEAVVDVGAHGAIANDGRDDSKAILAALAAAHEVKGPVTLRFGPGRYVLSEIMVISRSNLVVEGAGRGAGGTELFAPRPLRLVDQSSRLDELKTYLLREKKRQIEPSRNIDQPFSPWSWSGGFIWVQAPGSRPAAYLDDRQDSEPPAVEVSSAATNSQTLLLSGPTGLKPGDIVRIRWTSPDGPSSRLIASLYGQAAAQAGSRHHENPRRPIVVQTTRVLKVSGRSITIADPLLHAVGTGQPATLVPWTGLTNVGLRDFAMVFPPGASFGHHLEEGWNAIAINDLFDGFVDSVRVADADSGILTYNSASLTFRNILTEGDRVAHYAVHMGNVHNVLATGLDIHNPVIHSLSFNTQSTRSVFQHATVWRVPVLDQHAGANHQNLFDAVRMHVVPRNGADGWHYPLWDGSGASYWQPGHGRYNTSWNIQVLVESGPRPDEPVRLTGLDEGPDARIVGVHGNRRFSLDYRPAPYVERLNAPMADVPSLYDWQLARRQGAPLP